MTSHPFLGRSRTIMDSRGRDHISTDTFLNRLIRRSSPSSSSNSTIELVEELAGLEWSLTEFSEKDNQILIPQKRFICGNLDETSSLRFNDYQKKETRLEDEETIEEEYNLMNSDETPIYDTESELDELDFYETIGYSAFEPEYESEQDLEPDQIDLGSKTEETNMTLEQIMNKQFTELNIQDQVDDMLIESMTNLGL